MILCMPTVQNHWALCFDARCWYEQGSTDLSSRFKLVSPEQNGSIKARVEIDSGVISSSENANEELLPCNICPAHSHPFRVVSCVHSLRTWTTPFQSDGSSLLFLERKQS
jgi:hypothetical protein